MAHAGRDEAVVAAWSPDGSRIAVHYPGSVRRESGELLTMARDGAGIRILAKVVNDKFAPWNLPRRSPPADPAACSAGVVVPEPEANPGLVKDCETLLGVRETLEGPRGQLNWGADRPITEWEIIQIGGSPPRVQRLTWEVGRLVGRIGLTGTVPPQLAELDRLRVLNLSGHPLVGEVPGELGRLAELEVLLLGGTYLSGRLPPELGGLTSLQRLDLRNANLNGSIPSELSGLENLETLEIAGNHFTGCIPAELPATWAEQSELERCDMEGES